ncbi:NADH-quinone oxidoreductase subunit C 1 [Streptomyces sp. ADI96-02]|uniref:NADH-quinone oxidoreductase subunit C n=1 Tax=Streptomyces sp. ADI96-02 TaxID=1522760 RepID=UPI000F54E6E3|nr:NADH-quinone oxidoreductase subunit C [Streptomyces sp. ADI96-02]RPK60241.1 NADH-quinone oxidoreductase subunit C 1 [Streptomyces sp. ADI96-02]
MNEPRHPYDRLPDGVTELFGEEAAAELAYDLLTVDVPATAWTTALRTARDELDCRYFDWLSAVDEPGLGFRVCAHVAALGGGTVRRLMLRTTVPHAEPVLPSAVDVYAGAAWHERETHEMFGIGFEGHPHLVPLLLPDGFEGHPLRKDFVLAARVAKAWPGAKEPGESAAGKEHGGPKRRTMLPPGVPDPNEWGPLKGQLPPAAARPARAARTAGSAAAGAGRAGTGAGAGAGAGADAGAGAGRPAAGDRPARRTRSASEGSVGQRPTPDAPEAGGAGALPAPPTDPQPPAARPRRSRSASDGSASQQRGPDAPATDRPRRTAGPARSTDAPWHDAQPAFEASDPKAGGTDPADGRTPSTEPEPKADAEPDPTGAQPQRRETTEEEGEGDSPGPHPDTDPHPAGGESE